jgi:tryprostatin B 6-hydroxylase
VWILLTSVRYDGDKPLTSMHTSRDRPMHDRRRRIWSPAFSDKSLRNYEQRVKPYADQLVRRIEAARGKPVNVGQLVRRSRCYATRHAS